MNSGTGMGLQYKEYNDLVITERAHNDIPDILVVDVLQHVHEKAGAVYHFLGAVDGPVTAGDDQLEVLRVVRLLEAATGLDLCLANIQVSEQNLPLTQEYFVNIHPGGVRGV